MKALPIIGATRKLKSENPDVKELQIFDEIQDGVNVMASYWEPTEEERNMIAQGGTIKLIVVGTSHPHVNLSVRKPVNYKP